MINLSSNVIRVMPREMRLMTERIMHLTELPIGFTRMMWDFVMHSEALGLGGFKMLEEQLNLFISADLTKIQLEVLKKNEFILNAGNLHAWLIASSALDLLAEGLIFAKESSVTVRDTTCVEEIAICLSLGGRWHLKVYSSGKKLSATRLSKFEDPLLSRLLDNGCLIDGKLWSRIVELSQKSLTKESSVSLSHAGPVIVGKKGELIGREDNDDDTDLNLIKNPEMLFQDKIGKGK